MLSQNDPLWKLKKINGTTSTIGSYGCLLTCVTYILQKAGYTITPDQLAAQSTLFSGDMWVGWQKLATLYPKITYAWGETCTSTPAPIDKIIRELDDGYYPIIMLDYNPTTKDINTHYCIVIGHDDNKNLKIGDPWDGAEVWLDSRYGTQDEVVKILKTDVYHFEKVITDPSAWDRIKKFLDEKKADEGMVRAAFGALEDQVGLQRTISDLQDALKSKQETIINKDQIISDLNNTLTGKDATIGSYTDFLQKCASILNCNSDMASVTGQIQVAIDNEDKYAGCLTDKQHILDKQTELIKVEVVKATTQLTTKITTLNNTIKTLTTELDTKDKTIKSLNDKIIALKKDCTVALSFIEKIKKWLHIK